MSRQNLVVGAPSGLLALGLLFLVGCSNGGGFSGESCRARSDCQGGLACIAGTCVMDTFNVSQTAKACDVVYCVADGDCAAGEACSGGNCINVCVTDNDCWWGEICFNGACVDCAVDADCGDPALVYCENNFCRDRCENDVDCPAFSTCQAGHCVDGGCQSDRECIALTDNARATCNGDSMCAIACDTDVDCGSRVTNFDFWGCVANECQYLGCETDAECRAWLYPYGAPSNVMSVTCSENP